MLLQLHARHRYASVRRVSGYEPSCPAAKRRIAWMLRRTRWHDVARSLEQSFSFLRVFNYHSTPARFRDQLARQLDRICARYQIADANDMETLLSGSIERPTAIFSFDDGLANNLEVAAPLLEERKVGGLFAVTSTFPDVPRHAQPRWFREHIRQESNEEHADAGDLLSLTWQDVEELGARDHRICSHTATHHRVSRTSSSETLKLEIVESRNLIERSGRVTVDGFCWPVAFDGANTLANSLVRQHYSFALCSGARPLFPGHDRFRIYRTNVEASWPLDVVDLQLSGLVDVKSLLGRLRHRILGRAA
jgi:peptidoglycan/xylan/chitin deacetylase (PgdA/CDA1 family)